MLFNVRYTNGEYIDLNHSTGMYSTAMKINKNNKKTKEE